MLHSKSRSAAAGVGLREPLISLKEEDQFPNEVFVGGNQDQDIEDDADESETKKTPSNIIATTWVCLLAGIACKLKCVLLC